MCLQNSCEVDAMIVYRERRLSALRRAFCVCLLTIGLCRWPSTTLAAQLSTSARPSSCWLRDVAVAGDKNVWAACESGWVWHTTDGGQTWTWQRAGANITLRSIAFIDAQRGFVVGNFGLLLATNDGGQNW